MIQTADVKLTHGNSREMKQICYIAPKKLRKMPHKNVYTFEVPVQNLKLSQDLN